MKKNENATEKSKEKDAKIGVFEEVLPYFRSYCTNNEGVIYRKFYVCAEGIIFAKVLQYGKKCGKIDESDMR